MYIKKQQKQNLNINKIPKVDYRDLFFTLRYYEGAITKFKLKLSYLLFST